MIENITSYSPFDNPYRYGGVKDTPAPKQANHTLDSVANRKRLEKLQTWYAQERDRQAANRYQMALDEDFYDSMQWTEEDAQELVARGQAPLVFNEIAPTVNWILGTERRTRVDFRILPREKDDERGAEIKTKLLKYLNDVNKGVFHRSMAFSDAVKSGVGWLEVGLRGDPDEELLYLRREDWRKILYDSQSVEPDLGDARYLFREKWVDTDIAKAYFPDRASVIEKASVAGAGFGLTPEEQEDDFYLGQRVTAHGEDYAAVGRYTQINRGLLAAGARERVKLVECWYREPVKEKVIRGQIWNGQKYDASNLAMVQAVSEGAVSVFDRVRMEVRCAVFCSGGLLSEGASPYRHGRFPFVPIWCYRRKRDNAPYGIIRNLRDPQEDLNKRASKALYILSTNRVIMDKGAVDDLEELRQEIARPDAIIVKNPGRELVADRDVQLAEEHLRLMDRDATMIRQVAGVTAENLGRETNATSGRAILARQDQGGTVTTEIFDNLRLAHQLQGEIELALIEQYYTEEKVIRITNERGVPQWDTANKIDPATGEVLNDITASVADFVVSEQDYRSTVRQAMYEALFEVTGQLAQVNPQAAFSILDLVVEMADLPNKKELVSRIRQLNGQRDPDAEPTPEEQAAMQAQQQKVAEMEEMQRQAAQLDLAERQARIQKMQAESQKVAADAQRIAAEAQTMDAADPRIQQAMQHAQDVEREAYNAVKRATDELRSLQTNTQKQIQTLEDQLRTEKLGKQSKAEELASRERVELEKARILADAQVKAAQIQSDSQAKADGYADQLKAIQQELNEVRKDAEKARKDAEKALAEEKKEREKEKAEEKKEREAEKKEREKEKAAAEKDLKAKGKEQTTPVQPPAMNLTFNIDGLDKLVDGGKAKGGKKVIKLKKNPDGSITGESTEA